MATQNGRLTRMLMQLDAGTHGMGKGATTSMEHQRKTNPNLNRHRWHMEPMKKKQRKTKRSGKGNKLKLKDGGNTEH